MSFNGLIPKSYGGSVLYNAECWSLGLNAEITNSIVNSIDGRYNKNDIKFFLLFSLRGLEIRKNLFRRFIANNKKI